MHKWQSSFVVAFSSPEALQTKHRQSAMLLGSTMYLVGMQMVCGAYFGNNSTLRGPMRCFPKGRAENPKRCSQRSCCAESESATVALRNV